MRWAGVLPRVTTPALALAVLVAPAAAHGGGLPVTPPDLWTHWSLNPWTWGPLILLHTLYGHGVLKLWARAGAGRGIGFGAVAAFLLGEAVLFVALISPLHELGGTLQSAHMAQHALLILVAPPLLLAGRPGAALAHSLPAGVARSAALRRLTAMTKPLARPGIAALAHAVALWAWHAPPLYEAALLSPALHWLEHASFLATALMLWRAALAAPAGPALIAMAITLLHGGLLGALLTLSNAPFYDWYVGRADLWGLSALDDQHLAGAIMWAPMGAGYLALCLIAAARFLPRSEPAGELFVRSADAVRRPAGEAP
jgi:putative membrane protein